MPHFLIKKEQINNGFIVLANGDENFFHITRVLRARTGEKIKFIDIQNNLERIMDAHKASYDPDLECILETDRRTRMETLQTAMKQGEL